MQINIYQITFEEKPIYVGQTQKKLNNRFSDHKCTSKKRPKACPKLYAKINKYRDQFHEKFKIELLEQAVREQADERECFWIQKLDTVNNGCNIKKGGLTTRGTKRNQNFKDKLSKIATNRYANGEGLAAWNGSEEQRQLLSKVNKGRVCTWGDQIAIAKTSGPYIVTINNKEYPAIGLKSFSNRFDLNESTLRNAFKSGQQHQSKGHVISVRLAC